MEEVKDLRSRTTWFIVAMVIIGLVFAAGCSKKAPKTEAEKATPTETGQVATPTDTTKAALTAMVADPVCGMQVAKTAAVTADYEGTTYYFCSEQCKATFMKDPKKYITQKS
jgi:YHS domain-containing protein